MSLPKSVTAIAVGMAVLWNAAALELGLVAVRSLRYDAGAVQPVASPSVAAVVEVALPSIARVRVLGIQTENGKPILVSTTGTAWLVDITGYLVTNCHVVSAVQKDRVRSLTVEFADDRERLPAEIVGCDELSDLAVIHVSHVAGHRKPLQFAQVRTLAEPVAAIGYGLDLDGPPSVAAGIISGLGRTLDGLFSDLIQTNAAINHGNSGGPLLNSRGEVVGVITYKIPSAEGIAYARSADTAARYVAMLIRQGEVPRANLGFISEYIPHRLQERLELPRYSIMVTAVTPGSAAAKAKLRVGDLIYSIELPNGRTIELRDVGTLNDALTLIKPGETVKIRWLRLTAIGFQAARGFTAIPASEVKWHDALCTAPGQLLSTSQGT